MSRFSFLSVLHVPFETGSATEKGPKGVMMRGWAVTHSLVSSDNQWRGIIRWCCQLKIANGNLPADPHTGHLSDRPAWTHEPHFFSLNLPTLEALETLSYIQRSQGVKYKYFVTVLKSIFLVSVLYSTIYFDYLFTFYFYSSHFFSQIPVLYTFSKHHYYHRTPISP